MPFRIGVPAWGRYEVFGSVYGFDVPGRYSTTVTADPWGLQIAIPVVLLVLAWLTRRREPVDDVPADAVPAAEVPAAEVPAAEVPAAAAPAAEVPAEAPVAEAVDGVLHEPLPDSSPAVGTADGGRSRTQPYVPEQVPAA